MALEESPLAAEQLRAVVDICRRELLTSFGLRSLSPQAPQYRGQYGGDPRQRDSAYPQGTVWGWLIGPFMHAFLCVTGDPGEALTFLAPFENHRRMRGPGTASKIFEGDPPFSPQGCVAQAWTVAEVLCAWVSIGIRDMGIGARRSGKS